MAHGPDITPGAPGELLPGSRRGMDGWFCLARQLNGQWGVVDPAGRPCFVKAVHGVCNEPADTDAPPAHLPAVRLRTWGFNTLGLGGDGAGLEDGLAYLADVDFCRISALIAAPGVRLPDVFAPDWAALAREHAARVCAGLADDRNLLGWVSDDCLAWGGPAAVPRPGLLQVCLTLEPSYAAYHAAWEFLLALHGGSLDGVARAWATPLANKEQLREITRAETAIATRGYARDEARWMREFARRYFGVTAAAIRAVDPNHLLCGCRFASPAPAHVLAAGSYPLVDLPLLPWTDLPAPGAFHGPVLADDVSWATPEFWSAPVDANGRPKPQRLTSLERMLRRARTALRRMARHPLVVGYAWRQWRDDVGEQPPFARGLVHVGGAEARENTELIMDFNLRADALRRGAAKRLSP